MSLWSASVAILAQGLKVLYTKRSCIVWAAHSGTDRTPASVRLVEENGSRQCGLVMLTRLGR
eukprot:12574330-Heterocapsa_arctica.AAC.1